MQVRRTLPPPLNFFVSHTRVNRPAERTYASVLGEWPEEIGVKICIHQLQMRLGPTCCTRSLIPRGDFQLTPR